MEKLENQMSNVKEAYELIFVDGTRFPEVVLDSIASEKILGFPQFILIEIGATPFLITGNNPQQIDDLNPEWALNR